MIGAGSEAGSGGGAKNEILKARDGLKSVAGNRAAEQDEFLKEKTKKAFEGALDSASEKEIAQARLDNLRKAFTDQQNATIGTEFEVMEYAYGAGVEQLSLVAVRLNALGEKPKPRRGGR